MSDKPTFIKRDFIWIHNSTNSHSAVDIFRIESDGDVHIYTALTSYRSGAAMRLIPLTNASTEYFVPSYWGVTEQEDRRRSGFLVVSAYNNTCVKATKVGENTSFHLVNKCIQAGEVIQVFADQGDLTGVHIQSNRPVSVVGGHECAEVPVGVQYCDFLMDMAPPVSEWGTEFIVGPILGRRFPEIGYLVRIVCGYNGTEVQVTGKGLEIPYSKTCDKYQHVTTKIMDIRSTVVVTCGKPCMVIQYNQGAEVFSTDYYATDPFMMIITPNDHFANSMTFPTFFDLNKYDHQRKMRSYLTVVVPRFGASGVRLGNRPVADVTDTDWNEVSGQYLVASFPIEHDDYHLYHPHPSVRLMGYVYSHGNAPDAGIAYGFALSYNGMLHVFHL